MNHRDEFHALTVERQGDVLRGACDFTATLTDQAKVELDLLDRQDHRWHPGRGSGRGPLGDAESFDVNGAVTKIEERIAALQAALQAKGLLNEEGAVIPGTWDEATATALWNYGVIEEDASNGVRNPNYINALLDASFEALGVSE